MESDKQWRIDNARLLKGATLVKQHWQTPASGNNDHDHCSCCWAKFAEWDAPDIQHDGYVTFYKHELGASKHWICEQCFSDLRDEMQWHLERPMNDISQGHF